MNTKRVILSIITIISLIPFLISLITSINQPQVQSDLQLYQTNLVLQASEYSWEEFDSLDSSRNILLGENPDQLAINQYQKVRETAQKNLDKLTKKLQNLEGKPTIIGDQEIPANPKQGLSFLPEEAKLTEEVQTQKKVINQLNLKLGILQAHQNNEQTALETWNQLETQSTQNTTNSLQTTANILSKLWTSPAQVSPEAETTLKTQLSGWFRYVALKKLYQVQERKTDLLALEEKQETLASQALIKLSLVAFIPVLGGIIGLGLLIFFFIQLAVKKEQAILAIDETLAWKTPWTWETTWQVLIVGFFFIGQIILPILFSLLRIDATQFNLREKAIYVLATYVAISISGIGVLYLSIKQFFPLPKDWFKFQWLSNWIVWGIGGYLTALPLVVIVSLINQKIWDGQGGSNPLLSLALESQDVVVLIIFYVTAAIAAPFYEEIMFRGFLLPSLTRYIPVWGAIGISSLIFAVAHLNLSEVLPLAILGIVLGIVYTRSRNLLASMLLHSLWNSGTLFSLFLLGSGGS